MLKSNITCGEALVHLLASYGVDTVFGIPGVHTLALYRGLPNSRIRHVLARHEQGAGFMADGYARTTAKPGVCFVITGPGLTNIATPMGQAYADSIPMLVISSVNPVATLGKGWGELHETKDQRAITAPLTALSATAYHPSDLPHLVARAFSIFQSERPRPVHIEIPMDVLSATLEEDWSHQVHPRPVYPAVDAEKIEQAVARITTASSPVIIAGGGAISAEQGIQKLAEQLDCPVFTTVAAKGLLPMSEPRYAGSVLCVEPTWDYIKRADVVLALGTELASTDLWRDTLPITGELIRVDIDPSRFFDRHPVYLPLLGDVKTTVDAFNRQLSASITGQNRRSAIEDVSQLKQQIDRQHPPLQRQHKAVLSVIETALPTNTVVAADMTQIAYTANYVMPSRSPRQWLHPTGFGTLGYALPAAIGAMIADPSVSGLVLVGDGGFLYTLQEMATAVELLDNSLVVLLWNNQALGQIRDDMIASGYPALAVTPETPDFVTLAKGFGCRAEAVTSLSELGECLDIAYQHPGVTLIELQAWCL